MWRVVSGSASASGAQPRALAGLLEKMRPKAGENFHVGRGAHQTTPEGGRAPRDTGVATSRRARIGGVMSALLVDAFMANVVSLVLGVARFVQGTKQRNDETF